MNPIKIFETCYPTSKLALGVSLLNFLGYDGNTISHLGFILHIVHPQALVSMLPVFLLSKEEILSGDYQHTACFYAVIELHGGNGEFIKPEPEEHGAFGLMNFESTIADGLLQQRQCKL